MYQKGMKVTSPQKVKDIDTYRSVQTKRKKMKEFKTWFAQFEQLSAGRYGTFLSALEKLTEFQGGIIVETGCLRMQDDWGGGHSTFIFGKYCKLTGAKLYTIDIDPNNLAICKEVTKRYASQIKYIQEDSVQCLRNFKETIDLLYLDSMDFPGVPPITLELIAQATVSQDHNLREIKAAYDKLAPRSVVLLDDASLWAGGKPLLTQRFLLEKGWKCIQTGQQALWVRE